MLSEQVFPIMGAQNGRCLSKLKYKNGRICCCCSGRQVVCGSFGVVCRLIWHCCSVVDPLQIVGHSGVDAVVARSGAALPPAHDPQQEHCLLVLCHQGAAAVAFTRVLPALNVSGTEHVLSEHHTALVHALLCPDPWYYQPPQDV